MKGCTTTTSWRGCGARTTAAAASKRKYVVSEEQDAFLSWWSWFLLELLYWKGLPWLAEIAENGDRFFYKGWSAVLLVRKIKIQIVAKADWFPNFHRQM